MPSRYQTYLGTCVYLAAATTEPGKQEAQQTGRDVREGADAKGSQDAVSGVNGILEGWCMAKCLRVSKAADGGCWGGRDFHFQNGGVCTGAVEGREPVRDCRRVRGSSGGTLDEQGCTGSRAFCATGGIRL